MTDPAPMELDARRAAANENQRIAFRLLVPRDGRAAVGHRRFGSVEAVATGFPGPFFNPVLATEPDADVADVVAAAAWVESMGLRASINLLDDLLEAQAGAISALGFELDPDRIPVMALEPIPARVPVSVPGLEVRTGGAELRDAFHDAIGSGPAFRTTFGLDAMAGDAIRLAVGLIEGRPVSGAAAIRGAGAIGIYAVGTLPEARRRGYGRAVTWAVILAGASAWREPMAILQSSPMGIPLYEGMGFEVVARHAYFERPRPGPAERVP